MPHIKEGSSTDQSASVCGSIKASVGLTISEELLGLGTSPSDMVFSYHIGSDHFRTSHWRYHLSSSRKSPTKARGSIAVMANHACAARHKDGAIPTGASPRTTDAAAFEGYCS